jgi:predicted RNase H-like HicB family nuclease
MKIPVLVEPLSGNGFRATCGELFALTVEGPTREDALRKLQELIEGKLRAGAEIVHLEVPDKENPWLRMAGTLDPNDPMVQEWVQIMEENRRLTDEDPDYP